MKFITNLLLLFCITFVFAQQKKSISTLRTQTAPKIDGVLDDEAWINAEVANNFTQFRPEMGVTELEHQKTEVKITYNDNAIFIAAYLHDNPDEIMKQFTSRDNFGQSDFFGVIFNTNNDAQNDTEFFVFSSGTQADAVTGGRFGEDFGWNAVWDSAVKIVDDGWIVEMKIPYSALRFSNKEGQIWGLQFHRRFRKDNSQYSWNPIDRTKGGAGLYHGLLKGLNNLKPPTRLSFYPFASARVINFEGETDSDFAAGLDIKYGLSENFTLDATLIPDFSQVAFDNVSLNLGPFEQRFSEQRQFFTEGTDLFSKGNLFYSRRIGSAPSTYPSLSETETLVDDFPQKVRMLNAIKVSGRTKGGLGIGFFNAITEKTEVKIKNEEIIINPNTGLEETIISHRNQVVEPLSNYNIFVIDQQFNQNSSISLINTNVTRNGHFRDANVTAALFNITNKANTYKTDGELKLSTLNLEDGTQSGMSSRVSIAKISGKYQFRLGHSYADKNYDINDFGIQFRNNYTRLWANASYRIFEPTKKLNNFNINFWANYNRLNEPNTYTGNSFGLGVFAQTKKLMAMGGNINTNIGKQYDYYEPRVDGRYFISETSVNGNTWFSSNYNKFFALDGNVGYNTTFEEGRDFYSYWFGLSPRFKVNDHFIISYSFDFDEEIKERGFVNVLDNEDIVFGQRDQKTIINSISGSYNFNSLHALTLTFRNYWAIVTYEDVFYSLQENGRLIAAPNYDLDDIGFNPDVTFNTWNLDLKYAWEFAPGSQLIALYRNSLFNVNDASDKKYFESLSELFDQSMAHVFSLKLIYYLDYNNIKNVFQKKNS